MSKILVETDEYFELKEKLNKLSEINKSLKEKYTMLQKRNAADGEIEIEKYNSLKDELIGVKKDITLYKQENAALQKEKSKLLQDITLFKKEIKNVEQLKSDVETLTNKNKELSLMLEEFENRKKTKAEQKNQKESISICLTAWQTQDYIEECLDSIENQTYFKNFDDYEILLGIDGCEKTLEKVKQIQHKYRNLHVFMMNKNVGTYITTNTIMSIAKYKWLLRFDTDDIMNNEMIANVMKNVGHNIILKCSFKNFGEKLNQTYKRDTKFAHGVIAFHRDTFYKLGGYKPWKCSGDSDFIERASQLGYAILEPGYNYVYFRRRIHDESLSFSKDTRLSKDPAIKNGALRDMYKKQIKIDLKNGITKIDTVTENYIEIYDN